MKGMWHQIREVNTESAKIPTKQALRDFFEKAYKERRIELAKNEKLKEQNWKHLIARSKKLGKEIPIELQAVFSVPRPMVGSDFVERWKEWL